MDRLRDHPVLAHFMLRLAIDDTLRTFRGFELDDVVADEMRGGVELAQRWLEAERSHRRPILARCNNNILSVPTRQCIKIAPVGREGVLCSQLANLVQRLKANQAGFRRFVCNGHGLPSLLGNVG